MGKQVKIFEIDHYTVAEERIPKIKDRLDWEHIDSVDWERLTKQVEKASSDVVVVEGIFAFDPRLLPYYSKKVLIEIDRATFFQRRKNEIRWGDEPFWYLEHVWESNQKLIKAASPDIKLKFDAPDNVNQVLDLINQRLSLKTPTHGSISG